jgi:hypothetical protein
MKWLYRNGREIVGWVVIAVVIFNLSIGDSFKTRFEGLLLVAVLSLVWLHINRKPR